MYHNNIMLIRKGKNYKRGETSFFTDANHCSVANNTDIWGDVIVIWRKNTLRKTSSHTTLITLLSPVHRLMIHLVVASVFDLIHRQDLVVNPRPQTFRHRLTPDLDLHHLLELEIRVCLTGSQNCANNLIGEY